MHLRPLCLSGWALLCALPTLAAPKASAIAGLSTACAANDALACLKDVGDLKQEKGDERTRLSAERACELGATAACVAAGRQVRSGTQKTKADPKRARALFEKACAYGDASGCAEATTFVAGKSASADDHAQAFVRAHQACRGGFAWGCAVIGVMHLKGTGTPVHSLRAAIRFRQACEAGLGNGCTDLGAVLADKGAKAHAYHRGCALGAQESCARLGKLQGEGVSPSAALPATVDPLIPLLAKVSRLKAPPPLPAAPDCSGIEVDPNCRTGDPGVCELVFAEGAPLTPATYCARKVSCERGATAACESLGALHRTGPEGLRSAPEAVRWYEAACHKGAGAACVAAADAVADPALALAEPEKKRRQTELHLEGCLRHSAPACTNLWAAAGAPGLEPSILERALTALGQSCLKSPFQAYCAPVTERRALRAREAECRNGAVAECRTVGLAYAQGYAGDGLLAPKDPSRAEALLAHGCQRGDCLSCAYHAELALLGAAERQKSLQRAAQRCRIECRAKAKLEDDSLDDPHPCRVLTTTELALQGPRGEKKAFEAAESWCRGARECHLLADLVVSVETLSGGEEKRLVSVAEKACQADRSAEQQAFPKTCGVAESRRQLQELRAPCRGADPQGCIALGERLRMRAGEAALPHALWAYGQACALGSAPACARQWRGLVAGPFRDPSAQAAVLAKVKEACSGGDLESCGLLLESARDAQADDPGVREVKELADRKFMESWLAGCDAGKGQDCEFAGDHPEQLKALRPDLSAATLHQRACELGEGGLCERLATAAVRHKRLDEAYALSSWACAGGSSSGCERLFAALRTGMLSAELRAALPQRLGHGCAQGRTVACNLAADAGVPLAPPRADGGANRGGESVDAGPSAADAGP